MRAPIPIDRRRRNETRFVQACEQIRLDPVCADNSVDMGFAGRPFVLVPLPHSKPKESFFSRRVGNTTVSLWADPRIGLPYGVYPRLILMWLSTQAKRTRSRRIELGDSLSSFMRAMGLSSTGGESGSITPLRDQAARLFRAAITVETTAIAATAGVNVLIADAWEFFPATTQSGSRVGQSSVVLSEQFFVALVESAVPLDLRAVIALKRSSLAIDVYCWATYRAFSVRRETLISWEALHGQFGGGYPATAQGRCNFKRHFCNALAKVQAVYPSLRVRPVDDGLSFSPCATHVPVRARCLCG